MARSAIERAINECAGPQRKLHAQEMRLGDVFPSVREEVKTSTSLLLERLESAYILGIRCGRVVLQE